tara:strand:- start:10421 stop:11050 length:630 start_codon:yes stop_codon:yes gene_type:complete
MKRKLTILQTNLSNIQSIEHAVSSLGHRSEKITTLDEVKEDSILIIPGVGNFKKATVNIGLSNESISKVLDDKRIKIFGICLGMQLLFTESEEGGSKGLNLINGSIENLNNLGVKKIPNIGWRKVNFKQKEIQDFNDEYFYFVHSYAANPVNKNNIIGSIELNGQTITSMVSDLPGEIGNYIGCQFHPEKSGEVGLRFLDRILSILDTN